MCLDLIKKICEDMKNIILYMYVFCFGVIIVFLIMSDKIQYGGKCQFIIPNVVVLFTMFLLFGFSVILVRKRKKEPGAVTCKFDVLKVAVVCSLVLFTAQVYISYNIFFDTGWDVETIVGAAKALADNDLDMLNKRYVQYFSLYPNNLFLIHLFAKVLRWNSLAGVFSAGEESMAIIVVNCMFNTVTIFLLFLLLRDIVGDKFAMQGYFLGILLFGFSPWVTIPYSDSIGLVFPVLLVYIYNKKTEVFWKTLLKYVLLSLLSCVGYYIKPQIFIVIIAIVIVDVLKLTSNLKSLDTRKWKQIAVVAIVFASLLGFGKVCIEKNNVIDGFQINDNLTMGPTHYLMMGLNSKNNGCYYKEDLENSKACKNREERSKMNLTVARKRLEQFGLCGYMKHLLKKTLSVYNNGTFAWGKEGNFWRNVHEEKNTLVSPFLRNIYYEDGKYNRHFQQFEQIVWLFVLVCCLLSGVMNLRNKDDKSPVYMVLILAILGLTVFEILFEARARYLYIYAPIYVIVATIGMERLYRRVCKCRN